MGIDSLELAERLRHCLLCAASALAIMSVQAAPLLPPDIAMPVSTAAAGDNLSSTVPVSLDAPQDADATGVYQQMARYLAAQQTFFVELASTTTISGAGKTKQTGGLSRVWYRRPDHVVWTTQSDISASAMATDGNNSTLYLPVLSKYMVSPVTGNADAAVAAMSAPYGMVVTGLFSSYTTASLEAVLTGSPRLQKDDFVLGVLCNHLKLPTRAGEVDLWIAQGPIPLPVKIASRMSIPASPGEDNAVQAETEVSFRWRVNVELPDSTFKLKLPETAVRTDKLGSPVVVASGDKIVIEPSAGKNKKSKSRKKSEPEKLRDSSNRDFDLAFDPPPNLNQAMGLPSALDSTVGGPVPSLAARQDDVVQQAIRSSVPDSVSSGASYQPAQQQSAPPPPSSSAKAPGYQLTMLNGQTVNLAAYRGKKAVVLDFWATWCGPCKQSMPVVSQVANAYRARGVEFFAVNMAEDAGQVQSFVQKQGLSIPVALDPTGQLAASFGVSGIPHLVIIGKDGTVKGTHTGADASLQQSLMRDLDVALR